MWVVAHTSVRLSSFSPLSQYRKPIWLLSWMPFNGVAWVRRDRELCRITWQNFLETWYNCNETLFDRKLHYFGKFNKNMFWMLYQITNITIKCFRFIISNASALMNTRFVYLFLRILVMLLQMMKLPLLLLKTIVHVFCKKVRYHSKSCAFWHKFVLFIYMWTITIFANITRDSITCFLYQ